MSKNSLGKRSSPKVLSGPERTGQMPQQPGHGPRSQLWLLPVSPDLWAQTRRFLLLEVLPRRGGAVSGKMPNCSQGGPSLRGLKSDARNGRDGHPGVHLKSPPSHPADLMTSSSVQGSDKSRAWDSAFS